MLVDPTDDCTFWYTQEYYATTSSAGWQTRIGAFKFPGCVAGPSGIIQGYVKSTAGGTPIAGATVHVGASITTVTNAAGFYTVSVAGRHVRRDGLQVRLQPRHRHRPGRHRRRHDDRRRPAADPGRHLRGRRLRDGGRAQLAALGEGRGPPGRDSHQHPLHLAVERVLRDPGPAERLHLRLHGPLDVPGLPGRGPAGHPRVGRPDPELHPPGRLGQPRLRVLPAGRDQRELRRSLPAARLDRRQRRLRCQQHLEAERHVGAGQPDGRHRHRGRCRLGQGWQRLRAVQHRALVSRRSRCRRPRAT